MNQKLLWKIHNWLGLYTGLVIGLLCFTGVLAVFIPEVDEWFNIRQYQISSQKNEVYQFGDREIEKIVRKYPGFTVSLMELPNKKSDPLVIALINPGNEKESRKLIYAYVNPFTGELLGERDHLNGLTNFLRQFHVRLFDNLFGRQLVGLAGLSMVFITFTGLLIYGGFMRKQDYGEIRKRRNLRIFWADWHKLIGITAFLFNFVIAVTGAWLGLLPQIIKWTGMKAPHHYNREAFVDAQADFSQQFDLEATLKQTAIQFPELKPAHLNLSNDGTSMITLNGDIAATVYERHINKLVLDKMTLKPLYKYDIREKSFSDKLFFVQEALHFGDFAGIPLKVLYGLLGLTGSFLSISGFYIYLKRTRTGKKESQKPSVSQLIGWWTAITILLTLLVAIFHILIGYTLTSGTITILVYTAITAGTIYGVGKMVWHNVAIKKGVK